MLASARIRAMLALIFFDTDLDLPQHLLVDLADRCAERSHRGRGIEVEHVEKILMFEIAARLQTAAGHEGVGDADGGGVSESGSDVELIIRFEIGIRNDVKHIPLMFRPVFAGEPRRDLLQLLRQAARSGNAIGTFQSGTDRLPVLVPVLPQIDRTGIGPRAGIRHIKDIFQARRHTAGVDQGDALGIPPHITAHRMVPKIIRCAGRRVGALGEDQKLLIVGVFVEPRGCVQKREPALEAARYLHRRALGHKGVFL